MGWSLVLNIDGKLVPREQLPLVLHAACHVPAPGEVLPAYFSTAGEWLHATKIAAGHVALWVGVAEQARWGHFGAVRWHSSIFATSLVCFIAVHKCGTAGKIFACACTLLLCPGIFQSVHWGAVVRARPPVYTNPSASACACETPSPPVRQKTAISRVASRSINTRTLSIDPSPPIHILIPSDLCSY